MQGVKGAKGVKRLLGELGILPNARKLLLERLDVILELRHTAKLARLAETWGGRVGPGLVLLGVGSVAGAAAHGGIYLLAARLAEGIGFITVTVCVPAMIIRASSERDRKLAVTLWGLCLPIGSAFIMLVAPFLLLAIGWRGLWLATGALTFVVLAVVVAGLHEPAPRARGQNQAQVRNIRLTLAHPGPWLVAIIFCIYSLAQQSVQLSGSLTPIPTRTQWRKH